MVRYLLVDGVGSGLNDEILRGGGRLCPGKVATEGVVPQCCCRHANRKWSERSFFSRPAALYECPASYPSLLLLLLIKTTILSLMLHNAVTHSVRVGFPRRPSPSPTDSSTYPTTSISRH
jgi:hypothetical protein